MPRTPLYSNCESLLHDQHSSKNEKGEGHRLGPEGAASDASDERMRDGSREGGSGDLPDQTFESN